MSRARTEPPDLRLGHAGMDEAEDLSLSWRLGPRDPPTVITTNGANSCQMRHDPGLRRAERPCRRPLEPRKMWRRYLLTTAAYL